MVLFSACHMPLFLLSPGGWAKSYSVPEVGLLHKLFFCICLGAGSVACFSFPFPRNPTV